MSDVRNRAEEHLAKHAGQNIYEEEEIIIDLLAELEAQEKNIDMLVEKQVRMVTKADYDTDLSTKYTEGYAAAITFVSNAYQELGSVNTAAEIRNMHTPETAVIAKDRQTLLDHLQDQYNRGTSLAMANSVLKTENASLTDQIANKLALSDIMDQAAISIIDDLKAEVRALKEERDKLNSECMRLIIESCKAKAEGRREAAEEIVKDLTSMQVKGWNEQANPYSRTVEDCKTAITNKYLKGDV